jgi:Sulfotransferase family
MNPIAIAGMHRAGTSMVAKELRIAGLHLGPDADFVLPAPDNPGGFFEHAGFVSLDEDLLAATGGAWDHLPPRPPMGADDPRVADLRDRATALVDELAVKSTWGWKDPRTSLTARFWLDLLPELRVVVCVRHPLEVSLSLKKRNNTSYAHALSLWHGYYETLLNAVPEERRIVTHYDAHFRDTATEIGRLVAFAGLPESGAAAAEAASEPELRHHRLDIDLSEAGADSGTVALYERLREEAGDPVPAADPRAHVEAHARVDRNALDLEVVKERLDRRARQVASLERQRDELSERVAELEKLESSSVLNEIKARVESLENSMGDLEDSMQDLRYEVQDLTGREDAQSLRACRALVRDQVPRSEPLLVIAKGDPLWLDLYGRPTSNFPQDASGRYPGFPFNHGIAAIAHLEAQRLRGARFLLIPQIASWWTERFPDFATHLAGRYRVVADEEGAGMLVDLSPPDVVAEGSPRTVQEVINHLAAVHRREPAVLDCTGHDLAAQLPGRNVFSPPEGDALPYVDDTIDVVLVAPASTPGANGDHKRLAEARRVASLAVVTIGEGRQPVVAGVEEFAPSKEEEGRGAGIRIVVNAAQPDPRWQAHLEESVADEQDVEVVIRPDRWNDVADGAALVAIVEEGVLPLPGCFDAARATLGRDDRADAVAAKLLASDGAIEAAGTIVFSDGSWTGIAAGSHEIVAPWHEYVRESCGTAGLVFLTAAAVEALAAGGKGPDVGSPTSWAGELWAAGLRVVYQPDAAAVRAEGAPDTSASVAARVAEAWAPVSHGRPIRPAVLDEGAWRSLLAHEQVGTAWAAGQPATRA